MIKITSRVHGEPDADLQKVIRDKFILHYETKRPRSFNNRHLRTYEKGVEYMEKVTATGHIGYDIQQYFLRYGWTETY